MSNTENNTSKSPIMPGYRLDEAWAIDTVSQDATFVDNNQAAWRRVSELAARGSSEHRHSLLFLARHDRQAFEDVLESLPDDLLNDLRDELVHDGRFDVVDFYDVREAHEQGWEIGQRPDGRFVLQSTSQPFQPIKPSDDAAWMNLRNNVDIGQRTRMQALQFLRRFEPAEYDRVMKHDEKLEYKMPQPW